ncbi:MAG: bis(5'-nucleosyl)-tetraphosphatase (symmetrical) YqeK, partial [Chloroflexi bacterium]|nr:bis(5'-nucleosyl)-tetraphosphatase (symmetrical) YqeK [Chloroflexota bacterium]
EPMTESHISEIEESPGLASPALALALGKLPEGLYAHVQRVRAIARDLAAPLDLDPALVDLAAAAHDIARAAKGPQLLAEARRRGLHVAAVEGQLPVLLHGPVGADRLRRDFDVSEPQVLEAVHWHSTATPGLTPVAKVIFLADKLDPTKAGRYPFIDEVRELARENLDQAMALFLTRDLERLLQSGALVHPASVEARNDLLMRLKGR